MLEQTWIIEAFGILKWGYGIFAICVLSVVLLKSKTIARKFYSSTLVVVAFGIWPAAALYQTRIKNNKTDERQKERLTLAARQFALRCENAGEMVNVSPIKVNGIALMRWRGPSAELEGQFNMKDPYGHDCSGEDCLKRLVRVTGGWDLNKEEALLYAQGYDFVEALDQSDGKIYRYTAAISVVAVRTPDQVKQYIRNNDGLNPGVNVYGYKLERKNIPRYTAVYGVAWEDISTREDRENWVAGGELKIIDLRSNKIIAKRVGYLMDSGLGSLSGARNPWGWAQSYGPRCPDSDKRSWEFVMKILKP